METKVSIVLPTYNGEQYIRQSIESIAAQTFQDWELIIVNDASTDNTPKIAEEFSKKDARIRVIHNKANKKLPASLNIGFEYAKGEYLTWTSDDNRYLPNALAVMTGYLDKHPQKYMVKSAMRGIDAEGRLVSGYHVEMEEPLVITNNIGACFLYRKEVYRKVGQYDTSLYGVEDYDYWLRIEENFGSAGYIPEVLYEYRIHQGSLTATKKEMINRNLAALRKKHWKYIMKSAQASFFVLSQIYYDAIERMYGEQEHLKEIEECSPFIKQDADVARSLFTDEVKRKKTVLIFGAGESGKKAADILGERTAGFIDNDPTKIGTQILGLDVKSVETLKKDVDKYTIIIAVGRRYIPEIMQQLSEQKINHYCTWQTYLYYKNIYM